MNICGYIPTGESFSDRSKVAINASLGKVITTITLSDESLFLAFDDGTELRLRDDGQQCCEKRYMRTDDDFAFFIGSKLLGIEVKDGPDIKPTDDNYYFGGEHNVQFLEVTTDRGCFTMSSHNEHNGYYGGFCVEAEVVTK